ncbi:MAG: homocysteine S-methyltransferase family protein [Candidatus Poribacteria bacterium]|nr:homocysteine S-methyltransferase family protein [Candidatus Poribacteria bacterium]
MIYDGGFGSQLFEKGIELANSALANELYPQTVIDIHLSYINAGADAIGTNTFVVSPLHLEMAGKSASDADQLVTAAVQHAKAAIEKSGRDVYIAGSIGPSPGAIEADSGDTDFGIPNVDVRDAHERIISALAEGGADFFCIETMFSAKEAAIAVDVARRVGIPIAVNLTYKYTKDRRTGEIIYKTDWGHSAANLLEILSGGEFSDGRNLLDDVHLVGLNCGAETRRSEHSGMPYAINGVHQTRIAMERNGSEPKRIMAYPNAGMPQLDENHRTYYSQAPEEMVSHLPELIDAGAYILGGCCGTTPDHVKAFRQAVDNHSS